MCLILSVLPSSLHFLLVIFGLIVVAQVKGDMVKMCLFYPNPSGHARTDPIISQTCASDHVHTFYGPNNFHPDTTYEDLRDSAPDQSTTPFIENQSLYWHPSIYKVTDNRDGTKTYDRASDLDTSPYYRWDNSVLPKTEAFPPGFRMIAYSDQQNALLGGETGSNLFTECCSEFDYCEDHSVGFLDFARKDCFNFNVAFAMPTCWNGELGITGDHKSHMAYTVDGLVAGACPEGYNRRLPQIQLFVRIKNYNGANHEYTLSDDSVVFHVDFMNGWKEGKLQNIINNCTNEGNGNERYNPPCNCDEDFLTPNDNEVDAVCDNDVRKYILDEATDVVNQLPRGTCKNTDVIPKAWELDPPFTCSTNEPECKDSSVKFRVPLKGKQRWKNCKWVRTRATKKRCGLDNSILASCPKACRACDECTDSTSRLQFQYKGSKIARDCAWAKKKDTAKRCAVKGIAEACRATCGICSNEDENNNNEEEEDDNDEEDKNIFG